MEQSKDPILRMRLALNGLRLEVHGTIADSLEKYFEDVVKSITPVTGKGGIWIKTSERLPVEHPTKKYILRWSDTLEPFISGFKNGEFSKIILFHHQIVEWLDESVTPVNSFNSVEWVRGDDDFRPNLTCKQIRDLLAKASITPVNSQEEKDLIIAGLEEGSEMWKAEYDNCRALLKELVDLKIMKENLYKGNPDGKEYSERKPLAWEMAKKFLEKYQH